MSRLRSLKSWLAKNVIDSSVEQSSFAIENLISYSISTKRSNHFIFIPVEDLQQQRSILDTRSQWFSPAIYRKHLTCPLSFRSLMMRNTFTTKSRPGNKLLACETTISRILLHSDLIQKRHLSSVTQIIFNRCIQI